MSRQPKVLHVSSNRWNSAITEYALSAARALELKGLVSVFLPLKDSPAEARARGYDLQVFPLDSFGWQNSLQFLHFVREAAPDAIITYGGPETFLTRILRISNLARPCPHLVRFRGQELATQNILAKMRHSLAHGHVKTIIVPSQRLKRELSANFDCTHVHVVPLGIDTSAFTRKTPGVGHRYQDVVVFGRLDPIKGHAQIIKIFALLLKNWRDSSFIPRLHIIGEPANLSPEDIARFCQAEGLTLGQEVIGTFRRLEDPAKALSEAILGIIPSTGSEIICRVAEEFLACGTPVLVSGVGSLDEVLFPRAGSSYHGLSAQEAAGVLQKEILASCAETESEKNARTTKARELFSLETMGGHLLKSLAPYLPRI